MESCEAETAHQLAKKHTMVNPANFDNGYLRFLLKPTKKLALARFFSKRYRLYRFNALQCACKANRP